MSIRLEKDMGGFAAEEIEEIETKLKEEIEADELKAAFEKANGLHAFEQASAGEWHEEDFGKTTEEITSANSEEEQKTDGEQQSRGAKEKEDYAELKQNLKDLVHELGRGASKLADNIRRDIPNKNVRLLMKIGVGIAVISAMDNWFVRVAVAALIVYFIIEKDKKENAK